MQTLCVPSHSPHPNHIHTQTQNFATSANARVGSISLGILYGVNAFSCVVVPNLIGPGRLLSVKASLFLGAVTYGLFVASYVHLITLILYVSSAVLGIGAAFLWIAEGSFVTATANDFEYEFLLPFNSELGYFNGLFWSIFQFNQFLGNLLAALLFQFDVHNQVIFAILTAVCFVGCLLFLCLQSANNDTRHYDEAQISAFAKSIQQKNVPKSVEAAPALGIPEKAEAANGYDQLSWDKSATYKSPIDHDAELQKSFANAPKFGGGPKKSFDARSSVLLFHEYHRTQRRKTRVDLMATVRMWCSWRFLLVWPLAVYSGVTQGFQFGEFGAQIDSDSYTFYALAAFGLSDALFSSLFGKISDRVGRLPILLCAVMAHASVYVFLFLEHSAISQELDGLWIWLALGAVLGIGDAGFNTQILSLYPILLGDRPETFANFNLWQSASSCWCFFWHDFVSFKVKTATYCGVLLLAVAPIFLTSTGRTAARSKKNAHH